MGSSKSSKALMEAQQLEGEAEQQACANAGAVSPRIARRESSGSSTDSFTAINMEEEGLVSGGPDEPAQQQQQRAAPARSSAEAAFAEASSSFCNPAFAADLTAIPPAPPAEAAEQQEDAAAQERTSKEGQDVQHVTEGPELPLAALPAPQGEGEELVERCIVSGDMGGVLQQHGVRVTQRASDGAVVLELPGARKLLLVHDEQSGQIAPRCLTNGDSAPIPLGEHAAEDSSQQAACADARHPALVRIGKWLGNEGVREGIMWGSILLVGAPCGMFTLINAAEHLVDDNRTCRDTITRTAGHTGMFVGSILSGLVGGPIIGVCSVARLVLRPALLAGAVHASVCWVRRHRNGAARLIRMLSSGDLLHQIEALKGIAKRAAASPAFRREFGMLSGVELVLAVLADGLAAAQAAIHAAGQEQAAFDSDASSPTAPTAPGGVLPETSKPRISAKQPRSTRTRDTADAARTKRNTVAVAAMRARRGGVHAGGVECVVGESGIQEPVVGLSGPLPLMATQALKELLRSPEATVEPLVRAGGVTLLTHAAALSMFHAGARAPNGMLHAAPHAPLAASALQVLEAVLSAPVSDAHMAKQAAQQPAADNAEERPGLQGKLRRVKRKGDSERMAMEQEQLATAVTCARKQLASDPMAMHMLVRAVRCHTEAAAPPTLEEEEGAKGQGLAARIAPALTPTRLLQAIALEPAGKALLAEAEGVEVLAHMLRITGTGRCPEAAGAAASALHTAVRGSASNSMRLASLAGGNSADKGSSSNDTAAAPALRACLRDALARAMEDVDGAEQGKRTVGCCDSGSGCGCGSGCPGGCGCCCCCCCACTCGCASCCCAACANCSCGCHCCGECGHCDCPTASQRGNNSNNSGSSSSSGSSNQGGSMNKLIREVTTRVDAVGERPCLSVAAPLAADLSALLCVMDRYQHAQQ